MTLADARRIQDTSFSGITCAPFRRVVFSPHRRRNTLTDMIRRAMERIGIEVRVFLRGRRVRMAQQLADDGQAEAKAGGRNS